MKIKFQLFSIGLVILAVLFLQGCASITKDPIPPKLQLVGLQLQEVHLLEQRYLLKLRIQNPNDFDLDIQGVEFKVELNGEHFAQGLASKPVAVPRFGDAVSQILVSTTILNIARQLENGRLKSKNAKYRISGRVKLAGIPLPVSFENAGDLSSLLQGI